MAQEAPSSFERWLARGQTPLRVTALAFFIGFVAIVLSVLSTTISTGGTRASYWNRILFDLPFLVVPIIVLYYVVSHYSSSMERALAKTRYQASLIENVSDAIIATDLNFAITSWNAGAERLYGWAAEEVLGKNVITFLKTEFRGTTLDDVLALLQKEGVVRGEVSQVRKDGTEIEVKGSTSTLADAQGRRVGYVNTGIDVTEARQAEVALRESEERFHSVFDSSAVGISLATPDGKVIEANAALCSILGYSEREVIGSPSLDFIYPDDRERVMKAREEMLAGGRPYYQIETRFVHKDGHLLWATVTASSVKDAEGRPAYAVTIIEDVTARRVAEEEVAETSERFRAAFDTRAIGVSLTMPDGTWVRVNKTLADMLGCPPEELVGKSITDFLHPEDLERSRRQREALLAGAVDSYIIEQRLFRRDRGMIWVKANVSAVRGKDGELLYTVAHVADMTRQKEAEEELRESEERFRSIFESAAIGIGIASPDGFNVGFNETFRRMLGYSKEELLNSPILQHIDPEDHDKVLLS